MRPHFLKSLCNQVTVSLSNVGRRLQDVSKSSMEHFKRSSINKGSKIVLLSDDSDVAVVSYEHGKFQLSVRAASRIDF